jgi:hypothetical protein
MSSGTVHSVRGKRSRVVVVLSAVRCGLPKGHS